SCSCSSIDSKGTAGEATYLTDEAEACAARAASWHGRPDVGSVGPPVNARPTKRDGHLLTAGLVPVRYCRTTARLKFGPPRIASSRIHSGISCSIARHALRS